LIDRATSETFAPHLGEPFSVRPQEGEPFEVVLTSCTETPYGSPEAWQGELRRVPFSLIFHGPAEWAVDQQTCSFAHPALGDFALFVVPLGPDEQGMRYEAVIS
jgi:hypothetical protein